MMNWIESWFEGSMWNSRFVIILAVLGSLFAGFAIFYIATVDVVYLVQHSLHYAGADLTEEARKVLHDSTVSHIVEVVDGYLLHRLSGWCCVFELLRYLLLRANQPCQ